jgi:hypothetical protein
MLLEEFDQRHCRSLRAAGRAGAPRIQSRRFLERIFVQVESGGIPKSLSMSESSGIVSIGGPEEARIAALDAEPVGRDCKVGYACVVEPIELATNAG